MRDAAPLSQAGHWLHTYWDRAAPFVCSSLYIRSCVYTISMYSVFILFSHVSIQSCNDCAVRPLPLSESNNRQALAHY